MRARQKDVVMITPPQDLYDLDYFRGRASSLRAAFPETFFSHAVAVKANSVRGVLREAARLGLGGECASLQEAKHCLSLGNLNQKTRWCFSNDKVICCLNVS